MLSDVNVIVRTWIMVVFNNKKQIIYWKQSKALWCI